MVQAKTLLWPDPVANQFITNTQIDPIESSTCCTLNLMKILAVTIATAATVAHYKVGWASAANAISQNVARIETQAGVR